MKRIPVLLAAVAVACTTAFTAAPAQAGPSGDGQVVRDPSGTLVRVETAQAPASERSAQAAPTSAGLAAAPGTGCTPETYNGVSTYYCRAGAYQAAVADGATMSTPVQAPVLNSADNHTLSELAVQSSDGGDIVEIGWRAARSEGGQPRLFVYHWIDGQPKCYNATCTGFKAAATTNGITPGMTLSASSTPSQFGIQYYQGNWWLQYDNTWFGYFPGTLWSGTFTKSGRVQMFGEVSSTVARPCTNMGNGVLGTSASATPVSSVSFYNGPAATLVKGNVDDSTLYDSAITSSSSYRYGGPGAC